MIEDPNNAEAVETDVKSDATTAEAPADAQADVTEAGAPTEEPVEAPAAESGEPVEAQAAEAGEPTTRPGMAWYVLRVASNKEEQVRDTLERKIKIEALEDRVGRILVPTLKEKRMKAGALKVHERKLYPGYVFVEMACEEDGSVAENVWFLVKETTGVGDFIGSDGKPTSMPEHDVIQMLAASKSADEEPGLSSFNIKKGDQVKMTAGAFESYEGEVEGVDDRRGMVSVVISIFGRSTPVEVAYWELEKVE